MHGLSHHHDPLPGLELRSVSTASAVPPRAYPEGPIEPSRQSRHGVLLRSDLAVSAGAARAYHLCTYNMYVCW